MASCGMWFEKGGNGAMVAYVAGGFSRAGARWRFVFAQDEGKSRSAVGVETPGGVAREYERCERLSGIALAVGHGGEPGGRERVRATKPLFDEQALFGQVRESSPMAFERGSVEAEHFTGPNEELAKDREQRFFAGGELIGFLLRQGRVFRRA